MSFINSWNRNHIISLKICLYYIFDFVHIEIQQNLEKEKSLATPFSMLHGMSI